MSRKEALAFVGEARSLDRLSELEDRFAALIGAFGYTASTCVLMAEPGKPVRPRVLFGLGDAAQREAYIRKASHRYDPTFQAVFSRTRAFTWTEMEALVRSPESRALFSEARRLRRRGLVIPLHGCFGEVTSVVLTGPEAAEDLQSQYALQTCAAIFASHGRLLLDVAADVPTDGELSRRETQTLVWLSRGKSLPEIAQILEISPATAKTHLERAKAKLGEPQTVPAVMEAARRGWLLDPEDFD